MRKRSISILAILLAGMVSLPFSYSMDRNKLEVVVQDKMSVKPEDLPEPIKASLMSGAYSSWEVTEAFLITKEDKTQFYEIIVKKGSEMSKINLDKDGRKVE